MLESINIDYRYEYPNKNNEQNTSPSSYLNNLRNQIVHLRPNQKNDLLPETADNWNILILDVLRIVQKLYEDNQNLLS